MTLLPVDDLVRSVTEKVAERDGMPVAERAGEKLRALLMWRRPGTVVEARAILEAHLADAPHKCA